MKFLTEKKWKAQISKPVASKLRRAVDDSDFDVVKESMKMIYKEIHDERPDDFDEFDLEEKQADIDLLGDDEDDIDYALDEMYDMLDDLDIWIPLDEIDEGFEEDNEFDYELPDFEKLKDVIKKYVVELAKHGHDFESAVDYIMSVVDETFEEVGSSKAESLDDRARKIAKDIYSPVKDIKIEEDKAHYRDVDVSDWAVKASDAYEKGNRKYSYTSSIIDKYVDEVPNDDIDVALDKATSEERKKINKELGMYAPIKECDYKHDDEEEMEYDDVDDIQIVSD